MTIANVKIHWRNESEVVEDEFYNQIYQVKFSEIIGKYTLAQKSFVFNAVKFILRMGELP